MRVTLTDKAMLQFVACVFVHNFGFSSAQMIEIEVMARKDVSSSQQDHEY